GNRHASLEQAVSAAEKMVSDGADLIDIGGESTRPGAPPVPVDEELRRVMPVIEALAGRIGVPLSIDTWKSEVARAALSAGVEVVNDISGMEFDARMAGTVAETDAGIVLMHTRGRPAEMQRETTYADLVGETCAYLRNCMAKAAAAGIGTERVVLDPGIGFGKTVAGNLEIIRRLREFAILGRPLLVGPSRKSFIGMTLGRGVDERLFGTAAAVAVSLINGARIFRVHDVRQMRDVVDMAAAITAAGECAV
ncbi:MAG TPA: dihydropteroate synthase, partial [Geobacteraceae bacterium]|nr:dihydropteroate synthase [Geobacteraceae bacterium]